MPKSWIQCLLEGVRQDSLEPPQGALAHAFWFATSNPASESAWVAHFVNPTALGRFYSLSPKELRSTQRPLREWLALICSDRGYDGRYLYSEKPALTFTGHVPVDGTPGYAQAHAAMCALRANAAYSHPHPHPHPHPETRAFPRNTTPNRAFWDTDYIQLYVNTEGVCYINAASSFLHTIPSLARHFTVHNAASRGTRRTKPVADALAHADYFDAYEHAGPHHQRLSGAACREDPFYRALNRSMHDLNIRTADGDTIRAGDPTALVTLGLSLFLPKLARRDIGVVTQLCA
eukprot:2568383-Rhodomonas_salina.1